MSGGLCACGCGRATRVARQSISRLGHRNGEPVRFLPGHNARVRQTAPRPMRQVRCPFCAQTVKAFRRHAPPGAGWCANTQPHAAAVERFWKQVDRSGACWEWLASKQSGGYGQFMFRGKPLGTHVFAYELLVGPVPRGLVLDHLCRNRGCCNPSHLEAVTNEENLRRGLHHNQHMGKTHCPAGHLYDAENTYRDPKRGHRACKRCASDRYFARKEATT